jgi:hypothetical protein
MPGSLNDCTALTEALLDASGAEYDIAVPPDDLIGVAIDNAGVSGALQLMDADAVNKARLYRLWLQVDAATVITFIDGIGGTTQALKIKCPGAQTIKLDLGLVPWAQGSVNTKFFIFTSNAVQITGTAYIAMAPT